MRTSLDALPRLVSQPFAITQAGLKAWLSTFRYEAPAARAEGKDFFGNDLAAMRVQNGTGIIPIKGVLIRGANAIETGYGAISHYSIADMIDEAEADPSVTNVVFDIDSPGGTTSGTSEIADKIAGMSKPTTAFSDGLIGSAAYWAASQCDTICCTAGAMTGAIGAIITLTSIADMLKEMGVDVSIFQSGSMKSAGSELKKMDDAEKAMFQRLVDTQGRAFRAAVARKRSVADEDAQGEVYFTSDAVTKGLVDATVSGMAEAINKIRQPNDGNRRPNSTLEAEWARSPQLRAEFNSFPVFKAFRQAERQGRVFVSQRGGTEATTSRRPAPKLSSAITAPTPVAATDYAAQFSASRELQAEFTTVECYTAFMKAQRGGHIKLKK